MPEKQETLTLEALSGETIRKIVRSRTREQDFASLGDYYPNRPNFYVREETEDARTVRVGGDYQSIGVMLWLARVLDWVLMAPVNLVLSEPISVVAAFLYQESEGYRLDVEYRDESTVVITYSEALSQQKLDLVNALRQRNKKRKHARLLRSIFHYLHEVEPADLDGIGTVESHCLYLRRFEVLRDEGNIVANPEVDGTFLEDPEGFDEPEDVRKLIEQARDLKEASVGRLVERVDVSGDLAVTNEGINRLLDEKASSLEDRLEGLRQDRRRDEVARTLEVTAEEMADLDERTARIQLQCRECDHAWEPAAEFLSTLLERTRGSPRAAGEIRAAGPFTLFAAAAGNADRAEACLSAANRESERAKHSMGLRCPECTSGRVIRRSLTGDGEVIYAFPSLDRTL